MRPETISDSRFQISSWAALAMVVLLSGLVLTAWADTPAERTKRLADLSPEQKEDLLRKKQRFDALDDAERQRLRELHAELSAAPDAAQLQGVLVRYSNWLKALQPTLRAEVTNVKLPAEKRIERIKEIVREQETKRFSEFVRFNLPPEDLDAIYQWLDRFVEEKERKIMDAIHDDRDRRRIRDIDDDRARRRTLITRLAFRRPDSKMPFPSKDDIHQMVAGLSEATRKELNQTQDADVREGRAYELVFAAIGSIAFPPPSEEELRKFFAQLPAERRSPLENLDPDELQSTLRQMWRMEQFRERGGPPRGSWGGPSRGGDGPRGPRPGPPPSEITQPPGFANPAPAKKKT
jgi:hypothetical protein